MNKFLLAVIIPSLLIIVVWLLTSKMGLSHSIEVGIRVGLVVALIQSLISVIFLRWAWNKRYFYWVWGGGLLLRTIVFGLTAAIVYHLQTIHLMATLLSLVFGTTSFLILESTLYSQKK